MTPRLSIIIPTTGRPSLARALASLAPAGIGPEDEVIVVGDGPEAFDAALPMCPYTGDYTLNATPTAVCRAHARDFAIDAR